MQQHFTWTPMWFFIHTSFIFIWLLYLVWLPLHKLEFWISILKTTLIRELSLPPYKIQSVSTSAFTANLDLKPTGGKLSVRRSIFSETLVSSGEFPRGLSESWALTAARTVCEQFKRNSFCSVFPSHFHIKKRGHWQFCNSSIRGWQKLKGWWIAQIQL